MSVQCLAWSLPWKDFSVKNPREGYNCHPPDEETEADSVTCLKSFRSRNQVQTSWPGFLMDPPLFSLQLPNFFLKKQNYQIYSEDVEFINEILHMRTRSVPYGLGNGYWEPFHSSGGGEVHWCHFSCFVCDRCKGLGMGMAYSSHEQGTFDSFLPPQSEGTWAGPLPQ